MSRARAIARLALSAIRLVPVAVFRLFALLACLPVVTRRRWPPSSSPWEDPAFILCCATVFLLCGLLEVPYRPRRIGIRQALGRALPITALFAAVAFVPYAFILDRYVSWAIAALCIWVVRPTRREASAIHDEYRALPVSRAARGDQPSELQAADAPAGLGIEMEAAASPAGSGRELQAAPRPAESAAESRLPVQGRSR